MSRKLAVLVALCILLGTCIAFIDVQPTPSPQPPEPGTRAAAPPGISDNISVDTVWDDSLYSYIYIKKNIWVLEGATLTIAPGTTVRFDPGAGLNIRGGIIADGAPFQNISFIPMSSNPSPMSWRGIALENSTGPCIFDNVKITFSEYGIASWGAEANITDSFIGYTHYYAILAGEGSTMLIRNNFINFTTWAGIITGNRSDATVLRNSIRTSNHGIVCYDRAEISGNYIERCWLGILAWGDANITNNQIRDCMDGIHGFYASPRIENNLIVSCDGNGTRFIHSNALIRWNTIIFNNVGMDLDYESRHLLDSMEGNMVNGMDIKDCFFVGQSDLVLDGLYFDSGMSKGYSGSMTAQGSITLYDCADAVIRNCRIANTVNSVYAANSTFSVYNSTLGTPGRSHVYLEFNATGLGFNRSVDPDLVMIGGDNCLFQTFDDLTVHVRDYHSEPILGARVMVKEGLLVLHDVTTNIQGNTPNMVVKDRTVSESGVIPSPLSVEVLAAGYSFEPNPMAGIQVNQTGHVAFTDLGDVTPPAVLGLSVTDGDRSFPVNCTVTIRFNEPMNRTLAEGAFSISGNVTGTFSWEGWNMTFTPDVLEYGTHYTVLISASAADEWGNTLTSPVSLSFTTAQEPARGGNALIYAIVAIFIVGGMVGWLILKRLK